MPVDGQLASTNFACELEPEQRVLTEFASRAATGSASRVRSVGSQRAIVSSKSSSSFVAFSKFMMQ